MVLLLFENKTLTVKLHPVITLLLKGLCWSLRWKTFDREFLVVRLDALLVLISTLQPSNNIRVENDAKTIANNAKSEHLTYSSSKFSDYKGCCNAISLTSKVITGKIFHPIFLT